MPVERIQAAELPYGPDEPARTVLQIGWHRGGSVEVGVKCVRADNGDDYWPELEPIEVPAGEEGDVLEFVTLTASARPNGMFGQFDRDGINEAIRVLRRARNAAFGSDE